MNLSQLITLESRRGGGEGRFYCDGPSRLACGARFPRKEWGQLATREVLKPLGLFFLILKTLIFQSSVMFSKLLTEL